MCINDMDRFVGYQFLTCVCLCFIVTMLVEANVLGVVVGSTIILLTPLWFLAFSVGSIYAAKFFNWLLFDVLDRYTEVKYD